MLTDVTVQLIVPPPTVSEPVYENPPTITILGIEERGPIGPAGTISSYTFTAQATWTVHHNLNRFPILQLFNAAGEMFEADVECPDNNTAVVTHAVPITGTVLVA